MGDILQDGQGAARENETQKQQDSRSKSSQQEMSRGSSKLTGMSKRSGTRGEVSFILKPYKISSKYRSKLDADCNQQGSTTTTSALSKLTMRLNFLKERRSQIANELQNMDKGRTGQSSPSSGQNRLSEETGKGSGSNQESDSSKLQSPHVLDRGRSENGGGDRGRGSSGGSHPNTTPRTYSR